MIEETLYRQMVQVAPVLCVDIVIRTPEGFLLIRRANEPLKGEWWVVGGRIRQGETAREAAARKVAEEVGLSVEPGAFSLLGYFEDTFERSAFGEGMYHTLSLVFETTVEDTLKVELDEQSSEWKVAATLPTGLIINKPTGE